jgi:hypothetical protein
MMMIALAFVMYVSAFIYYEPINRQSREPDPELGYTVPHDIKGVTFYVTPLEDQLLDIHDVAFFVFAGSALIAAFIDKAVQSRVRRPAVTGLPFTRSDGLPAIVRLGALVVTLGCLVILALQTPLAKEYGASLPNGYFGDHIWITVLIGTFSLLFPKRVWTVTEGGLTREVHGLLGRKIEHFSPSQIAKVTVIEDIRRSGRTYYRLRIVLNSGRKITFEVGDAFSEAWAIKTALEDAIG